MNEVLLQAPAIIHTIIFGLSLICMSLLVFFPSKRIAIVLLVLEIIACLLDQNRLQLWEYVFVFLLATFVFIREERSRVFSWQLIIIGFYLFSGLNAFNSSFINQVWKELYMKQFAGVSHAGAWELRMGYLLPLLEIASAIALCFRRTVKPAMWVLIVLHLINLVVFGPFGIRINPVIWPWNVFMPGLVFILFYKKGVMFSDRQVWKPAFIKIVLLCWWILPLLQLAGLRNQYLAGFVYNRNVDYMYICTDDLGAGLKLGDCFKYSKDLLPCTTTLSVYDWGRQEMHVAPIPEMSVYKSIAHEWNKLYPGGKSRFFLVRGGVRREVREIWP